MEKMGYNTVLEDLVAEYGYEKKSNKEEQMMMEDCG